MRHVFWLLFLISFVMPAAVDACTVISGASIDLPQRTSFLAQQAAVRVGSGGSGLSCPGIVGLLSSQYIAVSARSTPNVLTREEGGTDVIPFSLEISPGVPVPVDGQAITNLSQGGLLSIGGTSSQVQLWVSLGAAANIAAGTYSATVSLKWYFATCASIGAAGACVGRWATSPGIQQGCLLLLCVVNNASLPGTGQVVSLKIKIVITADCRLTLPRIDFGAVNVLSDVPTVVGSISVLCTKGTVYTVGIGPGLYSANGQRRMAMGAEYVAYDIFRPGGLRWNNTDSREAQATPSSGKAPQQLSFTAKLYSSQALPSPGQYRDTVIVDLVF